MSPLSDTLSHSPLSIAIVGAGVSGCYAALALKRELPQAQITVIERLPVPYGLLRYGVAADHQGTKSVQQQFERLFAQGGARFVGGITLGQQVSLTQLLDGFDVVVLATGLAQDRALNVPGETLAGVYGAGRLTRALNSHPDEYLAPPVLPTTLAVVGAGNVAVDIVRLLARRSDEWQGSDMDDAVLARVLPASVQTVHLIVRSAPEHARWDLNMIRELNALARPVFHLASGNQRNMPASLAALLAARPISADGLQIHLHFETRIEAILGDTRVEGVTLSGPNGLRTQLAVGAVVTAIGFEHHAPPAGAHPRVYHTGWLHTGPQGAIAQQRSLAKTLASTLRQDHEAGRLVSKPRTGLPAHLCADAIDAAGWQRIDATERHRACAGRVRRKIGSLTEMRACAASPTAATNPT